MSATITIICIPGALSTVVVAKLLPSFTTRVLAHNRNTFLQQEANGYFDLLSLCKVMRGIAVFHTSSITILPELLALGIRDRTIPWQVDHAGSILQNKLVLTYFENNQARSELVRHEGEIKSIFEKLLQLYIPHILVHGNLDVSNIKCDTSVRLSMGQTVA